MNKEALIFKIFTSTEWAQFQADGIFHGSPLDIADGFIHISAGPQVQGTLDKHYTTKALLTMASINPAKLEGELKWEVSRGGAEFPHYYAPLKAKHIEAHYTLSVDEQGRYDVSHIL